MIQKLILFAIIVFGLAISKLSLAQVSSSSTDIPENPKYGLDLLSYYYSNLKSGDIRRSDMDFWVVPTYQVSQDYKLIYYFVAAKNFEEDKKVDISLSQLQLIHEKIEIHPLVAIAPGARFTQAIQPKSFNGNSLRGAILLENRFILDTAKLDLAKFTISYRPRFTYYLHKYTTAEKGAVNKEYQIQHRIDAGYTLTDKWSLEFLGIYNADYTYSNRQKGNFYAGEQVTYTVNKKLKTSIGHSNEADVLAANGADSNFNLIDDKTTYFYGNISYKF